MTRKPLARTVCTTLTSPDDARKCDVYDLSRCNGTGCVECVDGEYCEPCQRGYDSDHEDKNAGDEYSTLVDSLHSAGIDKLVKILRNEFSRRLTNMKCCKIRLDTRKNTIVAKILEHVKIGDQDKLTASIMATYFAPKEKVPPGEALWITSFSVGEIVLVNGCGEFRRIRQKGVVDKVNKTSVTVNLFRYTEIHDDYAARNQTHGSNRLMWLDTFDAKKVVKSRRNIVKKGECIYYDSQFIEGLHRVDYGN